MAVKRIAKYFLITLAVLFVLAQFVRPSFTNPPVDPAKTIQHSASAPPPHIDSILHRSCYDCHSSETRWPWYAQVSPLSWWLMDHVKDGRRELSFSEFATYSKRKAARKMQESCEQIEEGEMPLKAYLPVHADAKLSDADRAQLCSWFKSEQARILASMTPAERAEMAKARRGRS